MKPSAIWVKCPGYISSPREHDFRDYCTTCAPWWEDVPTCILGHKLAGSGFCPKCRKFYNLEERPSPISPDP